MDIRERVARAICESEMGIEMLDDMVNTAPRYYAAADAALSASGYHRMREALEHYVKASKAIGNNLAEFEHVTDGEFWDALWKAEDIAIAALGEDKT